MFATAGLGAPVEQRIPQQRPAGRRAGRVAYLVRAFFATRPVDMATYGVHNVFDASKRLGEMLASGRTGVLHNPREQLSAALKLASP